VPVRQVTLAGAVNAAGAANFLSVGTGLAVNLAATSVPVVVAFAAGFGASGEVDYVGRITADTSIGSLTANKTLYLYVDRNTTTGALTYGFTELLPTYGYGITKSTTNLQHTYRIDEGVMYVGNGSTATAVQRVFLGECVTGASTVTSVVTYALQGNYDSGWTATLPTTNVKTTLNHYLGIQPGKRIIIIECTTAEKGYTIGQQMDGTITSTTLSGDRIMPIITDRNTVAFQTGAYTAWNAVDLTDGTAATLTLADWKYKVVTSRGW
jgi:hypothetical protein